MNEKIPVVDLVDVDGRNVLFGSDGARYVVPVYQRAFSWGSDSVGKRQNEIVQLIEDVLAARGTYYLGSLVVSKCCNGEYDGLYDYEVIDGQQRLTALYLIFACLGFHLNDGALGYACREDSQRLLGELAKGNLSGCWSDSGDVDGENGSAGIRRGVRTILEKLKEKYGERGLEKYRQDLINAFKRVKLFRIEVPLGTDLNRYFEVMNTRGEQLEQQDIVKADLLSRLLDARQRAVFAEVWDACSDMDGYVQMHFSGEHVTRGDESRRDLLFGEKWMSCPDIGRLALHGQEEEIEPSLSFDDLVDTDVEHNETLDDDETYKNARFEGIVDFPHFLLHVLRVFVAVEQIGAPLREQTDSASLRSEFWLVFQNADDAQVMRFANCLLKCRFYFDKYILKREFSGNKDEGKWSLQELVRSNGQKEGAYYRNTQNGSDESWKSHEQLLMIEACLRVSYTNPKTMHWITDLLLWVFVNGEGRMREFLAYAQGIARAAAKRFLESGDYNLGVRTPHVVLNYLDYLLWMNQAELKSKYPNLFDGAFEFEFRSTVEHWYPQHPDADSDRCPQWESVDGNHGVVDRFGNLALLQSSINAHFSNQPPKGKCGYDSTKSGSLKLRIMAFLTRGAETNEDWRAELCEQHETEMLDLIRTDCEGRTR